MKRGIKASLIALILSSGLQATEITTLLDAIAKQSNVKLDALSIQRAELARDKITDNLMPKLDGFVAYERYNRPSSMRPVLPSEMKDPHATLPFSKGITRAGVNLSWPLFVKSLFTLKEKATVMHLASKDKARLYRLQKEAAVVGLVAQQNYLHDLIEALEAKERSIMATRKKISLMVKSGRTPKSKLMTLDANINSLKMQILAVKTQKNSLRSKLENLTGVTVTSKVVLNKKEPIQKGEIFALSPLNKTLKASKLGVKAAKERYYPTLALKGNYTYSQAEAYNNDEDVDTDFANAGLFLNLPIYDATHSTSLQEAKLDYMQNRLKIEDTKQTIMIRAKELNQEISFLEESLILSSKNIKNQKALLHIAKVSVENEVITQEEYLRYEDALAEAKATHAKTVATMWQDRAELAVIYGNDLKEIVK